MWKGTLNSEMLLKLKNIKYLLEVIIKTYHLSFKVVLNQVFLGLLVNEYSSTYESCIDMKVDPAGHLTFLPKILIGSWIQTQER